MKTLILSTVLLLLLAGTTSSSPVLDKKSKKERREIAKAASTFSTSMFISGNKLTVLVFKYGIPKRTTISLRDKSGDIVYQEYVNASYDKFGRVLNIDELEAGKYSIEVSSNGVIEKKMVSVSERVTNRSLTIQ